MGSKMLNLVKEVPYEVGMAARQLGGRLRLARKRRQMTQDEMAAAAGVTRKTLSNLESGAPGVSLGVLLSVLWKLGLLESAGAVADPDADEHGKTLELARLPRRVRAPASADNDF
jgi:transcriptional regulator with XRE-family HTH domain